MKKGTLLFVFILMFAAGHSLADTVIHEDKSILKGVVVENAFTVPRKAIYNDKYVYVIDDSVLVQKEVSIVRYESESVIINGGLENGDTLVVELLQGVTPGMPARSKLLTSQGEK